MTQSVKAEQTIQSWGNGLGIRITAPIARAAHFSHGQPVTVEVVEDGILVRSAGLPKLTLAQKLELFDPEKHGGEVMDVPPIGAERF